MSLALARKYRPRRFADVAVQSHVANTLRNAIAGDRLGHAYLFCGPRGTGKTTLARVLAMALNCENKRPDHEPCGECPSCTRIWSGGASLDVVEIDAASNRGVDDARELRERAMYAPSGQDRYKVYIVDEAHMLTREAWNALLKILEEPPPRVIFVFATTEPNKIQQAAAPVLSRMQRFDLKRIGPADVRARLTAVLATEGIEAQPDALGMLARAADGSMRDALSLTDQVLSLGGAGVVTAERVREALGLVHEDEHLALLDIIAERRAGDVFAAVARLADHGVDFGILLADFADLLRAQLAVVLGGSLPDLSDRLKEELPKRSKVFSAGDLLRMLNLVVEVEPHLKRSGQQQMLFETLLVRFALLDRTIDLESVLRGMPGGSGATSGPGGSVGGGSSASSAPMRAGGPAGRPAMESAPAYGAAATAAPIAAPIGASSAAPTPALFASPAPPAPTRAASPYATAPAAPAAPASRRAAPPGGLAGAGAPEVADRPAPRRDLLPLDINRVAEHWDAVVDSVNSEHRALLLSSTLAHATPTAVTAGGSVTLTVESESHAEIIAGGEAVILGALRRRFEGVQKVVVRTVPREGDRAPQRLNETAVKADRMATLRKQSPLLDAAVQALDLELME